MGDREDFPYKVEYAKSGRASCKKCKDIIAKDSLRLAVMVQSPKFDGKVPNWHHLTCFFTKQKPRSVEDIGHFDSVRWEDQEKIRAKLGEVGAATGKPKKGAKSAPKKIVGSQFNLEYAPSARAACKDCEEKIVKGDIRISKLDYDSDKAKRFGPLPRWHHVVCFVKIREALEFFGDAESLPGFGTLSGDDKKMLREKIPEIQGKRKAEDEPDQPVKKIKLETKEMERQSKKLFHFRDWLKRNLKKSELLELLEFNNYDVPKGESKILDVLSDLMTFGALETCDVCTGGNLVYMYGAGYICKGRISEWTKCTNVVEIPKRKPFKIPEEFKKDQPFLKKYKFKDYGPRIIVKIQSSQSNGSSANNNQPLVQSSKPLDGMAFVVVGDNFEKTPKEIEQKIISLGGTTKARVVVNLAAVITTTDTIGMVNKLINDAETKSVQCIPENFLDEVGKGGAVLLIQKMNLVSWGSDPLQRIFPPVKPSLSRSKSRPKKDSKFTKSTPDKLKVQLKDGVAVDPDSCLEDSCHVYRRGSKIYNCVLGIVDISRGTNSYYKLQLLEGDQKRSWYVFRSWGRIGTTIGGNKLEDMEDLNDAITNFETIFEEKTGNAFGAKEFKKMPNGWYPLELDYGQDKEDVKLDVKSSKSKLAKAIQNFVSVIFDVKQMKNALVEYEIDLKKMPLGKLSRRQIEKAYKILSEAQQFMEDVDVKPDVKELASSQSSSSSSVSLQNRLLDCSNRFYTLIPHDFGMKHPPLLDNDELIKAKILMLDNLRDIEIAYKLMKSEDDDTKGMDPIDKHYKKLNTEMEVLKTSSEEYKMVKKYIENTHAATHSHYTLTLEEVFKINRKGEKKRFKPFKKLPNRQLLWHGSGATNYAGILSQGLRIAPPEAPSTGYMFGKGVYFADMVSKSANYCRTNKSNPIGFLLLCDVALGDMYERMNAEYVAKLPTGKHSTKGLGKNFPNPAEDIVIEDGLKVPLGKVSKANINNGSLLYNEYIVYDVAQIMSKYLLQVKFNYKL